MPAIFGITVPWTTGSTNKEDVSPVAEDTESSLPRNEATEDTDTSNYSRLSEEGPHTANWSSQRQKPANDSTVLAQTREREASTDSATSALNSNRRRHPLGVTGLSPVRASLHPPRPPTRRSFSSPSVDTRLQAGDPTSIRIAEEMNTAARGRNTGEQVFGAARSRSARSVHPETRRPKMSMDSYSSPNLRHIKTPHQKPGQEKPLKTCLKQKANSTSPTPPLDMEKEATEPTKHQLRRIKTVEFQQSNSPICVLPHTAACSQVRNSVALQTDEPSDQNVLSPTMIRRTSTCPSTITTMKGDPANSAVTRTDVHVIAISPSQNWSSKAVRLSQNPDPPTPTMQIVESGDGIYKVIWDDLPTEHGCRTGEHITPARKTTKNDNFTAAKGLERVNTKLTEWSASWNSPSGSFKPTIVVYPEDDTRKHRSEYSMDHAGDNGDALVPPPNSTRTSAIPSRGQSHPASVSLSRETSDDEFEPDVVLHGRPSGSPPSDANQEVWSDFLVGARGRLQDEVAARASAQSYNNSTAFHNHQDSISIAHDRMSRAVGITRDMYTHRDSIALAKKRLHAKDRAASGVYNIPRPDASGIGAQSNNGGLRHSNSQTQRPMRHESPRSFS